MGFEAVPAPVENRCDTQQCALGAAFGFLLVQDGRFTYVYDGWHRRASGTEPG